MAKVCLLNNMGARLLEAVQEESLDKLLADLRHRICPQPKSVLGIPQLDSLLEAARYPDEITPERLAWQSQAATSPAFGEGTSGDEQDGADPSGRHESLQPIVKARPATIEFTSTKSASGKTATLSYLTAISVLPNRVGGKESTVVYIDADGRLSATRLSQIIQHYICQQSDKTLTTTPSSEVDMVTHEALNHIHIFRPQSSTQVLHILSNLPVYLLDQTRHQSTHRPLGLIVLDNATAFHWQDRFDRTTARLETPGPGHDRPSTTQRIIEQLKTLQTRFECAILFSTTSFPSPSSSTPSRKRGDEGNDPTTPGPATGSTDRGISPWTAFATLSLSLSRIPVPQFAPQMSLEDCLRDRDRRFEVVGKGRFSASVQTRKRGERGGGFGFRIGEDGLELE